MTTADPAADRLILPGEAATAALGARLAGLLSPGDVVALWGGLGAGKSVLARAILRALLGDAAAAIPSPSYTLVNVYDTPRGEVWHADLYRLAGPAEAGELGLLDAMAGGAILLIEWPDRLGADLPARRLDIALAPLPASEALAPSVPTLAVPAAERPVPASPAPSPSAPAPGDEPRAAAITAHGPGWGRALERLGGQG